MGELLFFRRRQVDSSPTQTDENFLRVVDVGSPTELRKLLRQGANPNVVSKKREQLSAVAIAVYRGSVRVRLLAEYGATMNIRDRSGKTPLHIAAEQGMKRSVAISRILLDHGAAVNVVDNQGWTPLMKAVQQRNVDLVELFLDRGGDPAVRNSDGETALDLLGDLRGQIINNIRWILQTTGSRC